MIGKQTKLPSVNSQDVPAQHGKLPLHCPNSGMHGVSVGVGVGTGVGLAVGLGVGTGLSVGTGVGVAGTGRHWLPSSVS